MTTSGFSGDLVARQDDASNKWRIEVPFRFYLDWPVGPYPADAEFVDVPDGFVTDFASLPAVARALVHPSKAIAKPATVHDKLYVAPVVRTERGARAITRAEADRIFLAAMVAKRLPQWQVTLVYVSVRVGGGASWRRYRRAQEAADGP